MCPAGSERYNRGGAVEGAAYIKARGAAAKHLERSVPTTGCVRQSLYQGQMRCREGAFGAHGGVCPAVSEQYRGGAAERWQGWQGAKHVERSVPMAGCVRQFQSGTIEVVPRSVGGDRNVQPRRVWRVRWAQGVVCLAVAEWCNRGAAKGLERSSCRAVGRSVCRDGERKAIWQWTQSGHRSGK